MSLDKFIEDKRVIPCFWLFIFLVSFFGRWYFLTKFPAMYSWDAFTRLWVPDSLFVRHWLPVPQLPILLADVFGFGLTFVRLSIGLLGSIAVVSFGIVVSRCYGHKVGMVTGLLLCVVSGFIRYTIVPYQEGALVAFIGLYLVCTLSDTGENRVIKTWLSVLFLGLACLTRYEAWIFMYLVVGRHLFERRWGDLIKMLPVILTPPAWILISPYIPLADLPPLSPEVVTPTSLQEFMNVDFLLKDFLLDFQTVMSRLHNELSLGLYLLPVGVVYAFSTGGKFGREILFFWFALFGLIFARSFHTHGVVTDRMVVVFSFIGTIYIAMGIIACGRMIAKRSISVARFFVFEVVLILIILGGIHTYYSIDSASSYFYPEYFASQKLEMCGENSTVLIYHRQLPNILKETTVGAIFANSFGVLDHRDSRFTFWPQQPERRPDYILKWTQDGYQLLRTSPTGDY